MASKNIMYPKRNHDPVWFHERNVHGAVVVYGDIGIKQYYGCTIKEAETMYKKEYWKKQGQFACMKG